MVENVSSSRVSLSGASIGNLKRTRWKKNSVCNCHQYADGEVSVCQCMAQQQEMDKRKHFAQAFALSQHHRSRPSDEVLDIFPGETSGLSRKIVDTK